MEKGNGDVMADIVVKDLSSLAGDLSYLISEFEGALDFENEFAGHWGQLNANLSMGDFADNWTGNRDKMVESMRKYHKLVMAADDAWTEGDRKMAASITEES
jgi:hypothetical protein